MNYLDIIIGVILIVYAIAGFSKGFIKSFTSLAGLILGIYLGIKLSDYLAIILASHFDMAREYLFIMAFIIIFIVVVIILAIIGKVLDNIITQVELGFLNKITGLLFGIIKGVLILSLIIATYNYIDPKAKYLNKETRENSMLYERIGSIAPMILFNVLNFDFNDPSWEDKKNSIDDVV
ncbi:MAG: CvpA family protein [Bacteroidales bacterium]|nr:CvpA family protein [Bacteroidales bacterium]